MKKVRGNLGAILVFWDSKKKVLVVILCVYNEMYVESPESLTRE